MFVGIPDILIIHEDAIFVPPEVHEPAKRSPAEPITFVYCFAEFRSKFGTKIRKQDRLVAVINIVFRHVPTFLCFFFINDRLFRLVMFVSIAPHFLCFFINDRLSQLVMFVSLPDIFPMHVDAIFTPHEAHEPAKRTLAEPIAFSIVR